ncbi:hypothetical protein GCM10025857_06760 [Alicyclobacillus contaminans]|uniref:hypothetical protein n=1 Tax=Alicyclobacillus contaminans TaxID=392016 RepID=UPI0003F6BB80|nr:hypothetical protein [Alicyclobacillus contaminans]GMA49319.1 hypothetical protein GCM10025857_06760 [Alicyclobacillus contaminans]
MPVNAQNIIIGPCSSFQVDGQDIGATSGGVEIQIQDKYTDIQIDQYIGIVARGLTDRTMTVKTQLAEATLQNLQIAWNQPTSPTTDAQSGAETLAIGAQPKFQYHTLTFVGPGPNGKTRTFTVNRATAMASGSYTVAKDKPAYVEVTFECLPDFTQPSGQEFGTVSEVAAS